MSGTSMASPLVAGLAALVWGRNPALASGNATIEGRAKATAKEIAEVLKKRFQEEGWIN